MPTADTEAEKQVSEYAPETESSIAGVKKFGKLDKDFPDIIVFAYLAGMLATDAKARRAYLDQDGEPGAWRDVLRKAGSGLAAIRSRSSDLEPLDLMESGTPLPRDLMKMSDADYTMHVERAFQRAQKGR